MNYYCKPIESNYFKANEGYSRLIDSIINNCQNGDFIFISETPISTIEGNLVDESEYDRIIACGGDGTINICVNSMLRHNIHLPLGIIPAGTANDFAYYFVLDNWAQPPMLRLVMRNSEATEDLWLMPLPEELRLSLS